MRRSMNEMDTTLYERAKALLDARLAEHRQQGQRLQSLRSREEADLPTLWIRERQLHPNSGKQYEGEKVARQEAQPERISGQCPRLYTSAATREQDSTAAGRSIS